MSSRRTKIVCTIGPASCDVIALKALIGGGMNVARLNFSHSTHDSHHSVFLSIRELSEGSGKPVGILFDTRGPAIRTGERSSPLEVNEGQEVLFLPEGAPVPLGGLEVIAVNYNRFSKDVLETDRILIENGEMVFDIVSIGTDGSVRARSRQSGAIGSRRHINLPGADIDLPTLSERDREDIRFASDLGADFISLSFIRSEEDIEAVRELAPSLSIIAKIETSQAIENISGILRAADGIMVARGDLGVEVPFEEVFSIQNEIVARCRDAGKPVIVATQMLESMTEHQMPTRAEVTDVAHAVETGADAVMLSEETATGKHPALVLEAMDRIIRSAEHTLARESAQPGAVHDESEAVAEAAVALASSSHANAIVICTQKEKAVRDIAKFRPIIPILAFVETPEVARRCSLLYGVTPLWVSDGDTGDMLQHGIKRAKEEGILTSGNSVALVSDSATRMLEVP